MGAVHNRVRTGGSWTCQFLVTLAQLDNSTAFTSGGTVSPALTTLAKSMGSEGIMIVAQHILGVSQYDSRQQVQGWKGTNSTEY